PAKQPKKGRLWLADGSCIRLRAERPNHVWSYDFVEDRTHDGRKYRMLNVIDEFTHEALAIRIDRKLNSTDVIETSCPTCSSCAACLSTSVPTTARSSSPRPCRTGSPPSGRRLPTSHPEAHGRMATSRASMLACATDSSPARPSTRSTRAGSSRNARGGIT